VAALLAAAVALPRLASDAIAQTSEADRLPVSQAERSSGPRLDHAVFRLVVPFRTQKDGGRWQTSNCGPATLGMLLDGFGLGGRETDDLRLQMHTYQGTVGMRTGIGLEHVAHVAEDHGVGTHGLYAADGSYRRWDVAEIVAALRQGRPVMPLVRLYLVPGHESLAPRWGHYILLTGLAPDGLYFSDSLKTDPQAGSSGIISERQLASAIAASHIPGQAVAFSGPRDLPLWLPDR
jgi:hypothetical protein